MAKTNKKRNVKVEAVGQAHIHASFNNIIISLTNKAGQVISWSSAGKQGFKGSKKNTPYAAQTAAEDCAKVAYEAGLRKVKVYVKGPGNGRESAIRTLHNNGIQVSEIVDVTPTSNVALELVSIVNDVSVTEPALPTASVTVIVGEYVPSLRIEKFTVLLPTSAEISEPAAISRELVITPGSSLVITTDGVALSDGDGTVSYTHLTLPTILLV